MRELDAEAEEALTPASSSISELPVLFRRTTKKASVMTRLSRLEKALLASLAVAVVLISVLISVLVLFLASANPASESAFGRGANAAAIVEYKRDDDDSETTGAAYLISTEKRPSYLPPDHDHDLEAALLDNALATKMKAKRARLTSDFRRRFPRAPTSAARRITHNLPRPLRLVASPEQPATAPEKVAELMAAIDADADGAADPWELHEWMLRVQNVVYRHALADQWEGFLGGGNENGTAQLTWPDYQSMVNPHGVRQERERRRFRKDRRRWLLADADGDGSLTRHEFKYFVFPQLSPDGGAVTVPEAHADLDADLDGRVSLGEFVAVHDGAADLAPVERYFADVLDRDGDGFLDVVEIAEWVEPTGFVQAKSEVVYLMETLDADGDKVLTRKEVLDHVRPFLASQVTFFGQIYKLRNLRAEVFQLNRV